jgi:hypothetical protein
MITRRVLPPQSEEEAALVGILETLRTNASKRTRDVPRRSKRFTWHVRLLVQVEDGQPGCNRLRPETVETCDISAGGMSFELSHYVPQGAVVRIDLPLEPVRRGMAVGCYCRHVRGRVHRVGVRFLHEVPPDAP